MNINVIKKFINFLIFASIAFGIYCICIKDNDGIAYISFIFSALVFILAKISPISTWLKEILLKKKIIIFPIIFFFIIFTIFFLKTKLSKNSKIDEVKDENEEIEAEVVPDGYMPVPGYYSPITDNPIMGQILSEHHSVIGTYTPPVSGVYRFDFDSNDTNADYEFTMYSQEAEQVVSSLCSNKGETVYLTANQQYQIVISALTGTPEYKISIGVPNEVRDIKDTVIDGTISYIDQEDGYIYKAPITGEYRFDFLSKDTGCNYVFSICDQDKKSIEESSLLSKSKTIDLIEGEEYSIVVKQDKGLCDYTINIGVPNKTQLIHENNFSGSITYVGQRDRYIYKAPITGKYRFQFNNDGIEGEYFFCMYTEFDQKIAETSYLKGGETVDLVEGEEYKIEVVQSSGMVNYTINIGVPNNVESVVGKTISGDFDYIDQENIYTYTAPVSGNYKFILDIDDSVNADYDFLIYTEDAEEIAKITYAERSTTVQLEQGKTYKIVICQNLGFPTYQISIIQ